MKRLRALPDIATTYVEPHDHQRYGRGHRERVDITATWALRALDDALAMRPTVTVADLSCGNGAVLRVLEALRPVEHAHYGDIAPGWPICGPIDRTLDDLPGVDLLVCGETLEHVEHPPDLLGLARNRAEQVVMSTPVDAWEDDNPEHLWAWSSHDVNTMLTAAGWRVTHYTEIDSRTYGEPYCYGIWHCI